MCADDAHDAYHRGMEILLRHARRLDPDRASGWLHTVVLTTDWHPRVPARAPSLRNRSPTRFGAGRRRTATTGPDEDRSKLLPGQTTPLLERHDGQRRRAPVRRRGRRAGPRQCGHAAGRRRARWRPLWRSALLPTAQPARASRRPPRRARAPARAADAAPPRRTGVVSAAAGRRATRGLTRAHAGRASRASGAGAGLPARRPPPGRSCASSRSPLR